MNDIETTIKESLMRHGTDVQTRPGAWSDVEKRVARNHKRRIAAGALAGALAIAGVALALPQLRSDTKPIPFESPVIKSTTAPMLRAKIAAPAFRLAATKDALWGITANTDQSRAPAKLIRIDPATDDVVARIDVGLAPHGLAVSNDSIWVANGSGCMEVISCGDADPSTTFRFPEQNSVMRIDTRTNKVVASVAVEDPQDVEIAFGSVWVTTGGDESGGTRLVRIEPTTNKSVAAIRLGETGFYAPITHDANSVWLLIPVAEPAGFEVARVDPATNEVERFGQVIRIENATFDLAEGFGSLWAIVNGTRSASALARIDPSNGQIIETIELPDASPVGLASVTTGAGYLWATSNRGYLWRVDPTTNEPRGDPILIGDAPPEPASDVAIGSGSAWVAAGDGKIWRFTL